MRRIKNWREAETARKYKKLGYEYLKKGWPDFIFYNDKDIVFVEVKRKQKRKTVKMGKSKHQIKMAKLFKRLGLKINYEYL